jgi:3-dehydroquinate dehydratase type I
MIELRLDYAAERLDLTKLRESTNTQLVATARLPTQGGRWGRGEGERQKLLLSAARAGFDYIDAEIDTVSLDDLVGKLHDKHASVIVSRHYLDRSPSLAEALAVHGEAKKAGADTVKVVGTALSPADNLACVEYLAREPGNVSFAMGAHGVPSRVLSPLVGGAWTYASASEGAEVAAGQMTLASLREAYRLMGVQD